MTDPNQAPTTRTFPRLYNPDRYEELGAIPQTAALFEPPPSGDEVTTNPLFRLRYLVLLTGLSAVLPVGLFDYPHEAVLYAREVRDRPQEFATNYFKVFGCPAEALNNEWACVSVIEFAGPLPKCRTELFEID
jgi:hypothetical protein